MSEVILDASALLALLNNEKGNEKVQDIISISVMSTVNISEVVCKLHHKLGLEKEQSKDIVLTLVNRVVDFDTEQSMLCAWLKPHTQKYGLSLGDRACLGLGILLKKPIYTADTIWSKIDLDCEINLIRQ